MTEQKESEDRRPMTVYYDGSCPLCVTELDALNLTARGFELVDCSTTEFAPPAAGQCGLTREAMLAALHVRDADGRWFTGVDAFEIIYRRTGHEATANWLARPRARRFNQWLYAFIARHKKWAARLGLHRPYGFVLRRAQRRLDQADLRRAG